MGERKVQCKSYPPDFDPSKIPRKRNQPKNHEMTVRMMLPMSIRCRNCRNFIGKGSKFNMKKEDVTGEKYLGIQVYRFTFKCRDCGNDLRFKTDPKNSDYVVEDDGATRNYEPWRDDDDEQGEEEEEEMGGVLKCLEKKTRDSKREMEVMANLDEMKSLKQRHARVSTDTMLEVLKQKSEEEKKKLEEEDDQLAKSIFGSSKKQVVRRLPDDDEEEEKGMVKRRKVASEKQLEEPKKKIVARVSVRSIKLQQQPKEDRGPCPQNLKSLMEKYEDDDEL